MSVHRLVAVVALASIFASGCATADADVPAVATSSVHRQNALYLGFTYGPLVRIAEDGTTTDLGENAGTSDLTRGRDGVVYAVMSGRVFAVDGDVLAPVGAQSPVRFAEVAARARDDVFAASTDRIAHFDGTTWTVIDDARFTQHRIGDLAFDAAGTLWVLTIDTLFRHRSGAFEEVRPMAGSSVLKAFVPNAAGGLDVLHFRGLDRYDGSTWSMVPIAWVERSRDGRLAFSSLSDAAFGGGMLALAADNNAELALMAPDVRYVGASSLGRLQIAATRIRGVTVDGRGRPWYATNGGLLLLERYGSPRITRWWPVHGFASLARPPTHVLAVGDGPTTLPEVSRPVGGRVRGNLGARYARSRVQLCIEVSRGRGDTSCVMNGERWSGVADARGRFTLEGVEPGGYAVLVDAGGRWYETTADCCAPREPGGEVDLDRIDVVR